MLPLDEPRTRLRLLFHAQFHRVHPYTLPFTMWMDRRGGLFIRTTALEPGKTAASPVDSRTSLSTISVDSLASNDTVAGMSIETSATSFIDTSDAGHRNISGASSSIAQYLTLSERMKIAKSTTVITQNTRACTFACSYYIFHLI